MPAAESLMNQITLSQTIRKRTRFGSKWPLLVCVGFILMSCTALKVNVSLMRAQTDLGEARDAGAKERAPYEYTRADRYLEKAQEEYLGGDMRIADALCREASRWADQAIIAVEQRGRLELDLQALENEQSAPSNAEAPAVAPAAEPKPEKSEYDELKDLDPDEEEAFDWEDAE